MFSSSTRYPSASARSAADSVGGDGWLPLAIVARLPRGLLDELGFDVGDVGTVQRPARRYERHRLRPELLVVLANVLGRPLANIVGLPDVERDVAVDHLVATDQQIHPGRIEPFPRAARIIWRGNTTPFLVQFDLSTTRTPSGSPAVTRIRSTYGIDIRQPPAR